MSIPEIYIYIKKILFLPFMNNYEKFAQPTPENEIKNLLSNKIFLLK